jgi:LuxR family maltose regulon positive regulatory protein
MSLPILATKLYIPPPRPGVVPRPHLIERLDEGLRAGRKLTLVSAPAGSGKTTLVGEWVAGGGSPAAWLSLDEGDNDPTRFLTYLVAALQTVAPDVGAGTLAGLQSPQPPPLESVLTRLLNEVAAIPDRILLVLDDYHVIESQPVSKALAFLLEHLPPRLHLVIATREDPPLPLARLRARGQLTELRAADLRFTPAEAAEFLNRVMGLDLSQEDVAALDARTEGWIAGLQLAALSMRGHEDVAGFVHSFTGSHRFVLDYLLEEVLHRQPESVQTFLLRTSILDRLCGSLCDAVVHGDSGLHPTPFTPGQEMLEQLERANLFILPLDDERRWYRYHHLFADLLRQRLQRRVTSPARDDGVGVAGLHVRASRWYEEHGLALKAFRHAAAAGDFERAADLAERAWPAMDSTFRSATWLNWVQALPGEVIRARPVLSVGYAWAALDTGQLEHVEPRLRDAERWLGPVEDMSAPPESLADGMVFVDEAQLQSLPARIALARSNYAQVRGDVSATVRYAELALELLPEEDHALRGTVPGILGLAYLASGDMEAAKCSFRDFITNMQSAGNLLFVIASSGYLAEIIAAQGHLHEAARTYRQTLQLASELDEQAQRITAHLHVGLAMLYHEMGDREAAGLHLAKSKEMGDYMALPDWPHRWCLARARLKEAGGELEAALDLLDEAQRRYVRNPVPDTHPIPARKARVYVRQGRLAEARAWVEERDLSAGDELSYLREFEHVTLARVLLAGYHRDRADRSIQEAMGLLERLLQAAQEGGRVASAIEILILQSLAYRAQGDVPQALASLERGLAMAEPQGYVRIFVDEGESMAALLEEAAKRGIAPQYVGRLRAAFAEAEGRAPVVQPLIEPLSERELEVLRLLTTELNGPQIARRLTVSLNTMRTHTKNIYSKLGVHSRRAAVRRAEELDLL